MANEREWDGRSVSVRHRSDVHKPVRVELTEKAARTIALALSRLKQTTMTLPGDAQELLNALDYVMVGDPNSTREHRQMEAGKGMTPDGGYRHPQNMAPREIRGTDGRSKL